MPLQRQAQSATVFIATAAVADWRPATPSDQKIKKDGSGQTPQLAFTENPDILATVAQSPRGAKRRSCFASALPPKATTCWTMPRPSACARACRCWSATSAPLPSARTTTPCCWSTRRAVCELPRASKLSLARRLVQEIAGQDGGGRAGRPASRPSRSLMIHPSDTPPDGDFARYVENLTGSQAAAGCAGRPFQPQGGPGGHDFVCGQFRPAFRQGGRRAVKANLFFDARQVGASRSG